MTVPSAQVVEQLVATLMEAGFDDVVSITLNDRSVFSDDDEDTEDLQCAVQRALLSGSIKEGSGRLRLVVSLQKAGIHSLVEMVLEDDERRLEHDVFFRWSSRLTSLRVRASESAIEYRERIRNAAAHGHLSEKGGQVVTSVARLVVGLDGIDTQRVEPSDVRCCVVVPGPTQIGRMRHLGFGGSIRPRVYRSRPRTHGKGAYDDLHVDHYYDPYHDLLSWILVFEAWSGRWDAREVDFVRADGTPINILRCDEGDLGVPITAVRFLRDRLVIDSSMPDVGFHPAEAGSPHAPGWGGEAS